MGINVNRYNQNNLGVNNITFNNNPTKVIGVKPDGKDSFKSSGYTQYTSKNFITESINHNKDLQKLLIDNKISPKIDTDSLNSLLQNHCTETKNIALKIVKNLPPALRTKVNVQALGEAAMLHDIGKVLIPPEILNKNSKLTEKEQKIMDLHSQIGYELLKNTTIDKNVLYLIKHHHIKNIPNNYMPDITLQILNLADKYSALTEERVYKCPDSPQSALTILKNDANPFLFLALKNSVLEK